MLLVQNENLEKTRQIFRKFKNGWVNNQDAGD